MPFDPPEPESLPDILNKEYRPVTLTKIKPAINDHRRLRSRTETIALEVGKGSHKLDVCLAYDESYVLREVNFVTRGKVGHGLDAMLHQLGIQLSRVIQFRDPATGTEK